MTVPAVTPVLVVVSCVPMPIVMGLGPGRLRERYRRDRHHDRKALKTWRTIFSSSFGWMCCGRDDWLDYKFGQTGIRRQWSISCRERPIGLGR